MPRSIHRFSPNLSGRGLRIGVVMSRFNPEVCEGLLSRCLAELEVLGVAREDIQVATVPGALEIPLALKTLAGTGRVDALIALGAVIRGETYHFEVVANDACRAIMELQMTAGIPVANGVLTTEDDPQALARLHKGAECAQVVVEMVNLMREISHLRPLSAMPFETLCS